MTKHSTITLNKQILIIFHKLFSSFSNFSEFRIIDFYLWPPVLEKKNYPRVGFYLQDFVLCWSPVGHTCSGRKPHHTVC